MDAPENDPFGTIASALLTPLVRRLLNCDAAEVMDSTRMNCTEEGI